MPKSQKPRKKFDSRQRVTRQSAVKLQISDEKLAHGLSKQQLRDFDMEKERRWAAQRFSNMRNVSQDAELIDVLAQISIDCMLRWAPYYITTMVAKNEITSLYIFPSRGTFRLYEFRIGKSILMSPMALGVSNHAWARISHRSAHTSNNHEIAWLSMGHIGPMMILLYQLEYDMREVIVIDSYGKSIWEPGNGAPMCMTTWVDFSQLHSSDQALMQNGGFYTFSAEHGIVVKITFKDGKTKIITQKNLVDLVNNMYADATKLLENKTC